MDPAARASRAALRVLHFRSTATFAGPERGLLTLGGPLRELGVDVKIIAYYRRRRPEPAIHRLVEQGRRDHLDVEQWADHSRFSWRTVRRLADELRRGEYDLLVTHDHKTNLMGYLAARRSKIPCRAVPHGYDFSLWRMRLYRRIDLVVLRRFPRIVAVSENLRRELIAAGLSPDRICVIPNGIDVARFAEGAGDRASEWRRRAAEPGAPVILTVGRLYRQKGLEDFVQSAAQIHHAAPRARFWIAGGRDSARTARSTDPGPRTGGHRYTARRATGHCGHHGGQRCVCDAVTGGGLRQRPAGSHGTGQARGCHARGGHAGNRAGW